MINNSKCNLETVQRFLLNFTNFGYQIAVLVVCRDASIGCFYNEQTLFKFLVTISNVYHFLSKSFQLPLVFQNRQMS